MKPIKNYVIVEAQSPERKTKSGLTIVTSYNPSEHVPVIGTIKELPLKLSNNNPIEAQIGDTVFMDRYACLMAWGKEVSEESIVDDNSILKIDGKIHFYINYGNMYMSLRGDKKIMLNNYLLVTPVKMKEKSDLVIDKEYYSDIVFKCEVGDEDVEAGQYIVIQRSRGKKGNLQYYVFPVEQHDYTTLEKQYYVVNKSNVVAIMNELNLEIK